MTRVDEFDGFYESTRRPVVAIAYAMTGDRERARRATRMAYRAAWRYWPTIRQRDALAFVVSQTWQHTGLGRALPGVRRRRERDSDVELLTALADVDDTTRHLICLMTLGGQDIADAAGLVGLSEEAALDHAQRGFTRLEGLLAIPIDEVVPRIQALREVTDEFVLPEAARVRRTGTLQRRRNLAALISVAVAATVLGGVVSTSGSPTDRVRDLPSRERLGAETADIVLDAQQMSTKDLLSLDQVSQLNPTATWSINGTDLDPANTTPYATCPTRRFADPDPLRVFVRAYSTEVGDRAVQSIEVSRSQAASTKAYQELVAFYADCEHPRVRLIDAWRVPRPFGDFTILRLVSQRDPSRFITVGLAQSGSVTSTLVHEVEGATTSDVDAFAAVLNDSVQRVCTISGGTCDDAYSVLPVVPPAIGDNPGFLAVVDLPPLASIDKVWSASDLQTVTDSNPAATPCQEAAFTSPKLLTTGARLYTIPGAEELPESFAIAQSVGVYPEERLARNFVTALKKALTACTKTDRPVTIDQEKKVEGDGFTGTTWRVSFEVDTEDAVTFRMGVVRRGAVVTQVLLPPAGTNTLSSKTFTALLSRAGERLSHQTIPTS